MQQHGKEAMGTKINQRKQPNTAWPGANVLVSTTTPPNQHQLHQDQYSSCLNPHHHSPFLLRDKGVYSNSCPYRLGFGLKYPAHTISRLPS